MTDLVATADPNSLVLAGLSIPHALPASAFHDLLGAPNRIIAAGQPAPVGHRNNHIHIYDDLGIYINEHHYTYLLSSVTFVLDLARSSFPPLNPFCGRLEIGDLQIAQPFPENDIVQTGLPFHAKLKGSWTLDGDSTHWIGLNSKRNLVHTVSVCVPHDPHDDSHRPT
ncbi:MAG: hypothetical protein ABJZ55_13295 [Fuerstiella sp.]